MAEREIVQLAACSAPETEQSHYTEVLFALCNDGTVWATGHWSGDSHEWKRLPDIPQGFPDA